MELSRIDECLGKRVVITTMGNVSYAGTLTELYTNKKKVKGYFVETDSLLGVSIWCPITSIKELVCIPIEIEGE